MNENNPHSMFTEIDAMRSKFFKIMEKHTM